MERSRSYIPQNKNGDPGLERNDIRKIRGIRQIQKAYEMEKIEEPMFKIGQIKGKRIRKMTFNF